MKNLTDITIILDRSGSMASVRGDTIGGFNAFLEGQQNTPGEAVVSLVQFDNEYEQLYGGKNIQHAPKLSDATFVPRGMTALYDAIGRTINVTGDRLAELPKSERPEKIVMLIMTDGLENASREFDNIKIAEMIRTQTEDYSWQFLFVGANQDAALSAKKMGIDAGLSMNYVPTADGVSHVMKSMSASVSRYRDDRVKGRSQGKAALRFTKDDKDAQRKAGVKNGD